MMIDEIIQRPNHYKTVYAYSNHIPIRRQRIERWINKDRSTSITNDKIIRSSTNLKMSLRPKISDNTLYQADRRLNTELFQLGEQREKFIEQCNFDQKVFAHKQALLHKNNHAILETLNHVKKCCKHTDFNDYNKILIDSTIDLKDDHTNKINHSRPIFATEPIIKRNLFSNIQKQTNIVPKEISVRHNKKLTERKTSITAKPLEISDDKEKPNHHVQSRTNIKVGSQSAHVSSKSRSIIDYQQSNRNITTVHGVRSYQNDTLDSDTSVPIINHTKEENKTLSKPKRPSLRTLIGKSALEEFRQYPERFLSKTNRYLPLLRHQNMKNESNECNTKYENKQSSSSTSRYSSESDLIDDNVLLSVIDEIETRKSDIDSYISTSIIQDHRQSNEINKLNKIDLMKTISDNESERKLALLRLRNREYNHLQTLIHTNHIDHIIKPLSSMKTIEDQPRQSINLNYILNSMDSLSYSKIIHKYKRKKKVNR
ncbi:unnamed protein product [Rotaria sp. Silwood1]|nr:unnamed protein product [Rotaria sp. Silwood1]